MKRICGWLLVMSLLLGLFPPWVTAAVVSSGTCGENLTWTLDDSGVLTISGTGDMTDYTGDNDAPWYDNRNNITTAIIENGVTSIGDYAFWACSGLMSVTIPNSVIFNWRACVLWL